MKTLRKLLDRLTEIEAVYLDIDDPADAVDGIVEQAADHAARLGLSEIVSKRPKNPVDIVQARAYLYECLSAIKAPKFADGMLSLREASALLGYTESGLRKIVARKGIESFQAKRWGPIKFKREWLDGFVDNHTKKRRPVSRPKGELSWNDLA
jgi:hypothetical protein